MKRGTKSMVPKGFSRRSVLQGSAAIGVASVIGGTLGLAKNARAQPANVHYELAIDFLDDARVYNGNLLGPTMRIRPGDTLDVDLINNLPALHDDCTDNHNQEHGLNTTNFHTHGLHVSPSTDSTGEFDADNVFVSLVPEDQIVACEEVCGVDVKTMFRYGSNRFRFELPDDHITGTFWYHAHKHGSTAVQVGDGLAGPLIVEDEPGVMPDYIEQAVERIFFVTNRGMMLVDEQGGGEMNPEITMRPGEVQRWRVINGTGNGTDFAFMRPNIANLEMHLIAFDGVTQDRRIPVDYEALDEPWFNPSALASGNRADFIVRAPSVAEPRDTLRSTNLSRVVDMPIKIEGAPVDALWSNEDTLPGRGAYPVRRY
ncbi:multicopper oxidase domain-containing protein [Octadecabacter sp. CECT 8868]|uniref:multicopper oxidase domain-containing protein n=1 Tax=Octadecabacter algicola TaxID=2909342 RepID=UPI001F3BC939|nr:multicopper oxidase domain-containing protein [Octadecabacter algicola]MCF2904259.1 multicopper oxidase domain-containing protein [Octadecabacter algicola]